MKVILGQKIFIHERHEKHEIKIAAYVAKVRFFS